MRTLSAIDAIAPAWDHTVRLLNLRNWRTLLKVGVVAVFAQMGGCNLSGNLPTNTNGMHGLPGKLPAVLLLASVLVVLGIGLVVLSLVFFYIGSRLQFVLFDVVLRRDTMVGPLWSRYGRATWHWMGLKVVVLVVTLVVASPVLLPGILAFAHTFSGMTASSGVIPPEKLLQFLGAFAAFFGAILLAIIVIGTVQTLLHDFGLPSMALESTTFQETLLRVWRLLKAEPLQVFLFLVMRLLMLFTGAIGGEIVLAIAMLIALVPLGGVGAALWVTLRRGGMGSHIVMVLGFAVLGAVLLALVLVAVSAVFGFLYTFIQAYALYFLGGRYPLLGEMLEPVPYSPPPPPVPFPVDFGS